MCGIAGFLGPQEAFARAAAALPAMAHALRHRGPDGEGVWSDSEAGIGLAHRRLTVIDLSDAGSQPMQSHDGRFALTFNGEIYNYQDMRAALEASGVRSWRGGSDTEVLLEWIVRRGLDNALAKADGMFAFGLWDRRLRRLTLARDPFGEKPLYYGLVGGCIVFASELKAFRAFPGFSPRVNSTALASFLRYGYVPTPLSIFDGLRKLEPGSYIHFGAGPAFSAATPQTYWSPEAIASESLSQPFSGDEAEAQDLIESLMRDAVARRMVSDVPIGCLLSGGVDSSLIAALMQANSPRPIKTFTVGSADGRYDEAPHARRVAAHIGSDHHEIIAPPDAILALAPKLARTYDEPFADSSQAPTYMVSEFARGAVTVALSGDGGDELFGGYNRYTHDVWRKARHIPRRARQLMSASATSIGPGAWDRAVAEAPWLFPNELRSGAAGDKIYKFADVLISADRRDYHEKLLSLIGDASRFMAAGAQPVSLTAQHPPWPHASFAEQAMLLDTQTYLPDDILVKTDRASMAHGLELRAPFLDKRLFAFAWRLPLSAKIVGRRGKIPLRNLLHRFVPPEIVERPKQGFSIPIGHWLRHDLRDWAEALLDERRLKADGYLNPSAVRSVWEAHLSGGRNMANALWTLLMFQSWIDDNISANIA